MNQVFAPGYAGAYDAMYRDKDYPAECDAIEALLRKFGDGPVRSLLDMGCGTGNHAIPLSQRGYDVAGIDLSESMLAEARKKAGQTKGAFHQGDVRTADLKRTFDAAIMMFAVLGYQIENKDVIDALKTARRHLRPGGLFLYDVWYGPAVLKEKPSTRAKTIPLPGGDRLLRLASGELDSARHLCTVRYHLLRLKEDHVASETEETHRMRFFFPQELNLFLETAGFRSLRLGAFPDIDRDPGEETWNVLGAARAV